jgi:L-threonylcarbamoyladenylate synthase
MILDGGPTPGGIESTVISLTESIPMLLRPGLITLRELEAVIGPVVRLITPTESATKSPAKSPGMMGRHYAPNAAMKVVANSEEIVSELISRGERVGWLAMQMPVGGLIAQFPNSLVSGEVDHKQGMLMLEIMPSGAAEYASVLYSTLHELDDIGVTHIVVDEPPDTEEWMAIRDRLRRASAQ